MVIESLHEQVQDLFFQVSQLNNKLVRSYYRVSDLEDELHVTVTSSNFRQVTIKISQLELERTQHLSGLSTGLLVKKSHVTTELNRLMEKATEEAARRGQAESARAEIEKDLDDLSAGLFDQANKMVAEARIAEARSSRKLEDTEAALRSAEEIVGALQAHMQTLESEKEQADRRMEDMRIRMGKGKWVERSPERPRHNGPRLLSTHLPYHDFLVFVSHLRAIRPATLQPPAMSTLLTLPFLARLITEDSYVLPPPYTVELPDLTTFKATLPYDQRCSIWRSRTTLRTSKHALLAGRKDYVSPSPRGHCGRHHSPSYWGVGSSTCCIISNKYW